VISCFWCDRTGEGADRDVPDGWDVGYSGFKGYEHYCPDCGPEGPDRDQPTISPAEQSARLKEKLKQVEAAERDARTRLGVILEIVTTWRSADLEDERQLRTDIQVIAGGGSL
jgi:hypothetical protein